MKNLSPPTATRGEIDYKVTLSNQQFFIIRIRAIQLRVTAVTIDAR